MRKILLGLVATAAIASPIALATSATAQVAVNDSGHGIVSKGDVQQPFNYNAPRMQDAMEANRFTFTINATMNTTTNWQCSGGVQSQTSTVTQERSALAEVRRTAPTASNLLGPATSWNIKGIDPNGTSFKYVSGVRTGAPYVGFCPAGQSFQGFLPHVFNNDVVVPGTLKVTGPDYVTGEVKTIALPNTN